MFKNGLRLFSKCQHNPQHVSRLSSFQTAKYMHEFNQVYDRNKDGFIDKRDIKELKRTLDRYHVLHAGNPNSPEYLTNMKRFEDFWILFKDFSDANKDGLISREEWLNEWKQINDKAKAQTFDSLPMWIRLMPAAMFPIIDTKKDGVIDFDEYRHFWFHVIGENKLQFTKTEEMFNQMTNDGKTPIDVDRFKELYADYYLSDDRDTPGKFIAGPTVFE